MVFEYAQRNDILIQLAGISEEGWVKCPFKEKYIGNNNYFPWKCSLSVIKMQIVHKEVKLGTYLECIA